MKLFKNHIIATLILAAALLQACTNEPDYKESRQKVLDLHDKIMIDGERAMNNKMKLDTLAQTGLSALKKAQPATDTIAIKQQIAVLVKDLDAADDEMNNWMHAFNADVQGKSNAEASKYFDAEMLKVKKVDSLYKKAIAASANYLKQYNIKADTTAGTGMAHHHDMKM
ncbi:hypothetical protein GCM10023149_45210 [Mucilaginibacter gynuensis]|uniref:Lipoprotein n=1 Tax=Mucilaginibacter gynuensis TaxID=1302236 RepID=A0ABP8H9Z4_9SPHI